MLLLFKGMNQTEDLVILTITHEKVKRIDAKILDLRMQEFTAALQKVSV